jgi:hypothetical protein
MATVVQGISIGSLVPFATLIPALAKVDGTNFPNFGPSFDAATDEQMCTDRIYAASYGASNPSVTVIYDWYSASGSTSGAVVWGASLSVLTPGDAQSIETDAWATENTTTTTVNATAKGLTRTTVTVTNLDSLTANDSFLVRIRRIGSNGSDTMTGDAILVGMTVTYPDT